MGVDDFVSDNTEDRIDSLIPSFLKPHRKFMAEKIDRGKMELWQGIYAVGGALHYQHFQNVWLLVLLVIIIHLLDFGFWMLEKKAGKPKSWVMRMKAR